MEDQKALFRPAEKKEAPELAGLLFASELGSKYYPMEALLESAMEEAFDRDCIYRIEYEEETAGILWFQETGAFHMFPYLHMLCLREEFRGKGLGRQAMAFLEEQALCAGGRRRLKSRIFLTVGEWNTGAQKFYESLGYRELCVLPDLYRKNIAEHLLEKEVFPKISRTMTGRRPMPGS